MMTNRDRLEQSIHAMDQEPQLRDQVFTRLYLDAARDAADAADLRLKHGQVLSPIDGYIVSIKDLFDVNGEPTTSGSIMLKQAPPATQDADVVQRLRRAGAVILGKTNMTEFAFSGIGINPNYGTPGNIFDPACIPGGSSSGAAISVAKQWVDIGIGSDTGGSVRIPAAFNGLWGLKPTQSRVSRQGVAPLSTTLDCIGPLTRGALDLALADMAISGDTHALVPRPLLGLRASVPRGCLFEGMSTEVERVFEDALHALSRAGVALSEQNRDNLLRQSFDIQAQASFSAIEASALYRDVWSTYPVAFDPFVRHRISLGDSVPAWHYVNMVRERQRSMNLLDRNLLNTDVLILPTVVIKAPLISLLQDPSIFADMNRLILRNTMVFNFFDLPALSVPIGQGIGLMVVGQRGKDAELLALGQHLERVFK